MAKEERITAMKKILDQCMLERAGLAERQSAAIAKREEIAAQLKTAQDKASTAWDLIGKAGKALIRLAKFPPKATAAAEIYSITECCRDYADANESVDALEKELKKAVEQEKEANIAYANKQKEIEKVQTAIAALQTAIANLDTATEVVDDIISKNANQP